MMDEVKTLISALGHELLQPTRAAGFFVELAKRDLKEAPRIPAELRKRIHDNLDKAIASTKEVFDRINSLDEIAGIIAEESPDGAGMIGDVLPALRQHFGAGGFTAEGLDDLPPLALSNAGLTHVFGNLLANSMKYRRPGEELTINLDFGISGTFAVFRHQDNGIGLPDGIDPERIFRLYYRASKNIEGKGIGLALCRLLLSSVGGEIFVDVESKQEHGLTIVVKVPFSKKANL